MNKILKVIVIIILIAMSITCLVVQNGYNQYQNAISQIPLEDKVNKLRNKEKYTKISEVPEVYLNAVISIEDHRFYQHNGIDLIAIGRAIFNDLKSMEFVEGGSTITQQIAKNEYFTQEKKMTRKIAEVFMAFKIEKHYSKDEILELYLNTIYFGNGYYNLKDATQGYFGKSFETMTDSEWTMLAGIPNAPSIYNPKENWDLTKQRQKQVVEKMIKYRYLTQEKANEILDGK